MAERGAVLSERGRVRRAVVVGAGMAGLTVALELCRRSVPVLLVSIGPALHAPSATSKSGVNAAAGVDGDDPRRHFEDTLECGCFLANQPPVRAMCESAPRIVDRLARMGAPFDRDGEGLVARRRLPGSSRARTVLGGNATGLLVVGALDEQLRRYEARDVPDARGISVPGQRLLERLVGWELLKLVLDDNGVVVGVVVQELRSMRIRALPADAVCLATGGASGLFVPSTAGWGSAGAAIGAVYLQGAVLANPELVEFHPTTFAASDKHRPLPASLRAAGARIWLPKDRADTRAARDIPDRERDYFLERIHPHSAELVPNDLAARAIHRLGREKAAAGARDETVYLDATEIERAVLDEFSTTLEAYERLTRESPIGKPFGVLPAAHATLGGLWVDYEADFHDKLADSPRNQATSLPGLYAAGDCEYQFHGACRLDGNGALSRLFAAELAAAAIAVYRGALSRSAYDLPSSLFDRTEADEKARLDALIAGAADEAQSPRALLDELGRAMTEGCGLERHDAELDRLRVRITEMETRAADVTIGDSIATANQSALAARRLEPQLALARAIVVAARARRECRGVHHKPELESEPPGEPCTTLVQYVEHARIIHEFEYACAGTTVSVSDWVNTSLVAPRSRPY